MELWTGLAALKPNPKCVEFRRFGRGKGAYVNIVAWAESLEHFSERVRLSAEGLDCILIELKDVRLLEEKMQEDGFPHEFINMRATAYRQPNDMVYGTFHTWLQNDAN